MLTKKWTDHDNPILVRRTYIYTSVNPELQSHLSDWSDKRTIIEVHTEDDHL
jgi:hypothetical protein